MPAGLVERDGARPAAKTSCIGATLSVSRRASAPGSSASCMSLPTQRLPSWATFSSSVISASSSSTRSADGRAGSCHGVRTGRSAVTRSSSRQLRNVSNVSARPGDELVARCLTHCDHGTASLDTVMTENPTLNRSRRTYIRTVVDRKLSCDVRPSPRSDAPPPRSRGSRVRRSAWTPRRPRGGTSCVSPWACRRARRWPPAAAPGPSRRRRRRRRAAAAATYWYLSGPPQRGVRTNARQPVQPGQPERPDPGHDVPERRLQDQHQTAIGAGPGARPSSGAGAAAACAATCRPARSRT